MRQASQCIPLSESAEKVFFPAVELAVSIEPLTPRKTICTAPWIGCSPDKTAFKLEERSGWQKAAVALANKNARILWAVMTKGAPFDARHASVKPCGLAPSEHVLAA